MKKLFAVALCFIALFPLFAAPSHAAEFKKTRIAVLDFEQQGSGYESSDMGKIVAEWLITAFVKEGRFDVIERRLLQKVLNEQKLGVSGVIDEVGASRLGKVLGAKVVITGSLNKYQNVIEANARIIDVETGGIIAAEIARSTSTAKLEDLVMQMAGQIIKDFPLEGYIVKRSDKNVLLDLGARHGVKKGMRFIVYKEGNIIKHPKTGEILDIERIETGTVEVGNMYEKTAEGTIVSEKGMNAVQYGQLVKSVKEATGGARLNRLDTVGGGGGRFDRRDKITKRGGDVESDIALVEKDIAELKGLKDEGSSLVGRKNKETIKQLKILSKKYGRTMNISLTWAKYYFALHDYSEADDYFETARKASPKSAMDVYLAKADMYNEVFTSTKKNDFAEKMAEAYAQAVEYAPDQDTVAALYLKIGNINADNLSENSKAKRMWQKAFEAAPSSEEGKLAKERYDLMKSKE